MKFIYYIIALLICKSESITLNLNMPLNNFLTRRSIFKTTPTIYNVNKDDKLSKSKEIDYYSKWSFFGLVPPPIEKTLTYNDLLNEIKKNNIISLQIAVQHDCVIATTKQGHRLSLLIPDNKVPKLIVDSMDKNGNIPFVLLPIDPVKQKIREIAKIIFYSSIIFYTAADLDIIKIDTTAYNSIEERYNVYQTGKPPSKFLKKILNKFINSINNNIIELKNLTNTTHNKTIV